MLFFDVGGFGDALDEAGIINKDVDIPILLRKRSNKSPHSVRNADVKLSRVHAYARPGLLVDLSRELVQRVEAAGGEDEA